jgi:crotonobetainyl-CoA:carnitine CoA-transferase CaiB-like acyl-CoA transferase
MQRSLPMEEALWPRLCEVLERPDLAGDADTPARRENAATLAANLDRQFAMRAAADWAARLKQGRLPFSIVNRIEDVATGAQAVAAGAIIDSDNPEMPRTIAAPFRFGCARPRPAGVAPALGEHTHQILSEAGLDAAEISELKGCGSAQ